MQSSDVSWLNLGKPSWAKNLTTRRHTRGFFIKRTQTSLCSQSTWAIATMYKGSQLAHILERSIAITSFHFILAWSQLHFIAKSTVNIAIHKCIIHPLAPTTPYFCWPSIHNISLYFFCRSTFLIASMSYVPGPHKSIYSFRPSIQSRHSWTWKVHNSIPAA